MVFRIQIAAEGMRRFKEDGVLRALDAPGWVRYSGPLNLGVAPRPLQQLALLPHHHPPPPGRPAPSVPWLIRLILHPMH